ncbi:MAG: hypothetical protein DRO16_04965 [Thermoprotei archaeon]|nr:MAG: hypothetical protein DRO16_04965 [Thermoprotei archaeon]
MLTITITSNGLPYFYDNGKRISIKNINIKEEVQHLIDAGDTSSELFNALLELQGDIMTEEKQHLPLRRTTEILREGKTLITYQGDTIIKGVVIATGTVLTEDQIVKQLKKVSNNNIFSKEWTIIDQSEAEKSIIAMNKGDGYYTKGTCDIIFDDILYPKMVHIYINPQNIEESSIVVFDIEKKNDGLFAQNFKECQGLSNKLAWYLAQHDNRDDILEHLEHVGAYEFIVGDNFLELGEFPKFTAISESTATITEANTILF